MLGIQQDKELFFLEENSLLLHTLSWSCLTHYLIIFHFEPMVSSWRIPTYKFSSLEGGERLDGKIEFTYINLLFEILEDKIFA